MRSGVSICFTDACPIFWNLQFRATFSRRSRLIFQLLLGHTPGSGTGSTQAASLPFCGVGCVNHCLKIIPCINLRKVRCASPEFPAVNTFIRISVAESKRSPGANGHTSRPALVCLCGLLRIGPAGCSEPLAIFRNFHAARRQSAIECCPVVPGRVPSTPPLIAMQVCSARNYSRIRPVTFMDGYC